MSAAKLRNFRAGPREVLNLEQFLRLPEIKPPLEFLNGRVEQKVSPNLTHGIIATEFPAAINDFTRRRRLGRAVVELRCSFGGESFVPDVSYFVRGRLPRDAKGRYLDDVLIPPDLAIEIISPGQTVANLSARLTRCVAKGVRLAWLVQPREVPRLRLPAGSSGRNPRTRGGNIGGRRDSRIRAVAQDPIRLALRRRLTH